MVFIHHTINNNKTNNNINSNNNKYNINENNNNLATNDYENSNHNNTNNKIANNENKSNFKINIRKKSVYIVGDSMVKEVNGFELSKSIKYKYSVRVRFYPSAKTSCLHDHVKPVIRNQEPDHIILHTGTNDLLSDKTPVQICNDIVNLAVLSKYKDIKVTISEMVERSDFLNEKVVLVNEYLSKIWKTIELPVIKHHNIKPDFDLNQSKLHLNEKGNTIFVSNFRRYLNNLN